MINHFYLPTPASNISEIHKDESQTLKLLLLILRYIN